MFYIIHFLLGNTKNGCTTHNRDIALKKCENYWVINKEDVLMYCRSLHNHKKCLRDVKVNTLYALK